jgi:hypothetical protein
MAGHERRRVTLTAAQKKAFARDGFVVVPRVVPRRRVDAALREINHRLGAGAHPGRDGYADSVDYLSEYVSTPVIMDLMNGSPLPALAESLLGVNRVERCSQAQIALRFPSPSDDAPAKVSVHVDGLYPDSGPAITRYTFCAGVVLSDVTADNRGNFLAYPGSHRLIAEKFRRDGLDALRGGVARVVDLPEPVQVKAKAGDAILFHFQTAHDKARNDGPEIRYMAYFRFWHVDAWRDKSPEYLERALTDPWLEWPGMRGVHGT